MKLAGLVPLLVLWAQAGPIVSAPPDRTSMSALPAAGANPIWTYADEGPAWFDQNAAMRRCLANHGVLVWNLRHLDPLDPVSLRSRSRFPGSPITAFTAFTGMGSGLFALAVWWSRRRRLHRLRDAPVIRTTTYSQTASAPARAA